jgi:hypothetical protein
MPGHPISYLRVHGIFGTIRAALAIYRRSFWDLFVLTAIFELPAHLAGDLIAYVHPTPLLVGSTGLMSFVAITLSWCAIVSETSQVCLGAPMSVRRALNRLSFVGLRRLLSVSLALICSMVLAILVPPGIAALVFDLDTIVGGVIFVGVVLVGVLTCVALSLAYMLIAQVVLLEQARWRTALARSFSLLWVTPVRTTVAFTVFALVGVVVPTLLIMPAILWNGSTPPQTISEFLSGMVVSLCILPMRPLLPIMATLWYYSLRITTRDVSLSELANLQGAQAA